MVVDSLLPHAECEPNDHRKYAPPFRVVNSALVIIVRVYTLAVGKMIKDLAMELIFITTSKSFPGGQDLSLTGSLNDFLEKVHIMMVTGKKAKDMAKEKCFSLTNQDWIQHFD